VWKYFEWLVRIEEWQKKDLAGIVFVVPFGLPFGPWLTLTAEFGLELVTVSLVLIIMSQENLAVFDKCLGIFCGKFNKVDLMAPGVDDFR